METVVTLIKQLPKNAPWIFPSVPKRQKPKGALWVNAHIHPATIRPDGTMYKLSPGSTYIPCDITSNQLTGVMRVMGSDLWIAKGQTCFEDNESLTDSLAAWNENGVRAKGYGVADDTITEKGIAELLEKNVCGIRAAWLGHLRAALTPEQVYTIAEKAEGSGFSINLYFPAEEHLENGLNLRAFIKKISKKTPILLDHICRPNVQHPDGTRQRPFQALLETLDENEGRVTVLLSCPDRIVKSAKPAAWKAVVPYKQVIADRFEDLTCEGTDINHPNEPWGISDDGQLWDAGADGLTETQARKASSDNPIRIFWNGKVPTLSLV